MLGDCEGLVRIRLRVRSLSDLVSRRDSEPASAIDAVCEWKIDGEVETDRNSAEAVDTEMELDDEHRTVADSLVNDNDLLGLASDTEPDFDAQTELLRPLIDRETELDMILWRLLL